MTDMPDLGGKLGPFLATMVVMGGMIGSGIYMLPASLGTFGSISIIGWALAAAGATMLGGVFSFLAILRPNSAGLFAYISESLGPGTGFVVGVLYWASGWVGTVPIAVAATGYLSFFFPQIANAPGSTLATLGLLWLSVVANIIGPKLVARIGGWTLTFGLAPVLLVSVAGWFYFHPSIFMASWNVTHASVWSVAPSTAVIVFMGFLGIEFASIIVPLVKNPARNVPIATLGGLACAAIIYLASGAVIMGILPAAVLAKSSAPFAVAAAPILGSVVAGAVAFCAMFKSSGTVGVSVLVAAETARSDAVLGHILPHKINKPAAKASATNLIFLGAIMSVVTVASTSASLGRQFAILANVTVVLSMAVYATTSLVLLRVSGEVTGAKRHFIRACAVGAGLFSCGMIVVSEADLLIWSGLALVFALIAYWAFRLRPSRRMVSTSGAAGGG